MRQLLISVVLILLIVMTALCIKNGVNIGKLHVLGISQIQEENDELTEAITEEQTANADYSNRLTILKTEISKLISAKEECLQLINVSSESQLEQATQTKNYTIEYLWSKLGNHATQEGVDIKIVGYDNLQTVFGQVYHHEGAKDLEYYLGMGYMNGIIDGAMRQTMPDILEISMPEARAASEKHLDSDFCFESSHYSLTL